MEFLNKYPYTDFHELNLDWILSTIKSVEKEVDDFTVFNTITWAGEWNAAKSYVKWTIVQDYNGNGYISTQAIPVNVPLTNENYWIKIANYDVLFSAFNSRIENNTSEISSEIKNRQDADNSLKSTMNAELDKRDNSIKNLNNEISEISNKIDDYYIFIGDSYAVESVTGTNRWPVSLANLLGLSSSDYTISSQGSTGFIGITTNTWLTLLNNAKPTTGRKVTHIIVAGGANDTGADTTALQNAIATFMSRAKELYPYATVYLANIAYNSSVSQLNRIFTNVTMSYEHIRDYGGVFLPYCNFAILDKSLLKDDGVHPIYNGSANRMIAAAIFNAMKSTFIRNFSKNISFTPVSGVSIYYLTVSELCTDNQLGILFEGNTASNATYPYTFTVEFSESKNVAKQIHICDIDSDFPCPGGQDCSVACMIGWRDPYPHGSFVPGKLIISQNGVYVEMAYQSTPQTFIPAVNCSTIDIFPTGPIIYPFY